MNSILLCGIDGGGTTTSVVVCNQRGEIVSRFRADSINHYGMGLDAARNNYRFIADTLVSRLGRLPDMTFIGSSALDDEADTDTVFRLTGAVFTTPVVLHSDVYIALLGFTQGGEGALIISGTGSMACAIDADGCYHTCGGWGQTLGDEGSGYHLGLKGIKAALRASDGTGPETSLTQRLLSFYRLDRLTDLIELVYNPPVEKSRLAAFAVEVERAALEGDRVAMRLVENEAEWLCRLAEAILCRSRTSRLGLYGSMVVKSPIVAPRLFAHFAESEVLVDYPRFRPEIGALLGAFRRLGIAIDQTILDNLSHYH